MAAQNSIKNAIKSASYNMILQIVFRIGTFLMNAVLLRYISRELLGIANVRVMLLYSTILFLSREAIRKACLSRDHNTLQVNQRKQLINLIWMCVFSGILFSLCLSLVWIFIFEQPSQEYVSQYKITIFIVSIATVLELTVEPLWIFGQKNNFIKLKVILEGIYLAIRSFISVVLTIIFPASGLYAFAVGFAVATSIYIFLYYGYMWWFFKTFKQKDESNNFLFKNLSEFLPDFTISPFLDSYYKDLVVSFYKQSLLKQFLTEGEKYVMTIFSILTFGEQGIYDIINNIGSLAARFIFMPIEESCYTYFSQILVRGKSVHQQSDDACKSANEALYIALKFVSLAGLIILVFGISYSELLLDLYGGNILSSNEGPLLLKTYCLYVFLLAINGITECFMFAGMSKQQVDEHNYKMLVFSFVFLMSSLFFTKYFGSVGFIWANCCNMALRISQSLIFIKNAFQDTSYRPLEAIIPSHTVKTLLVGSILVTTLSEHYFCCSGGWLYRIIHVGVGGVCLLSILVGIYFSESSFVTFVKQFIYKKKNI